MSVIKTIKFDLPIDGVKVKTLVELQQHFTTEILDLYKNGLLARWLQAQGLNELLSAVNGLSLLNNDALVLNSLCEIFNISIGEFETITQLANYHASGVKIDPEQLSYKTKYESLIEMSKAKGQVSGFQNEFVGSDVSIEVLKEVHKIQTGEDIILVPVSGFFIRDFDGEYEVCADKFALSYYLNVGDFVNFKQLLFSLFIQESRNKIQDHSNAWGWQQKQQLLQEWQKQQAQYISRIPLNGDTLILNCHVYSPCQGVLYKKVKPNSSSNKNIFLKDRIEKHTIAYLRIN